MSVSPSTQLPSSLEHGRLRPAIVESLLMDIVQGRLRLGDHLVTQKLADRFGVSHTPIREALMTLAGLGVIDLLPNRGATVRKITREDVSEICIVRQVLECEAVRSACGRTDASALEALGERLANLLQAPPSSQPDLVDQARALDSELHDLIARSSGNLFLAKELGRLGLLFRVFRDAAWEHEEFRLDFRRLSGEAREHLAIVQALLAGDARRASAAMKNHIESGRRYWCRALPTEPEPPTRMSPDHPASTLLEEV